MRVALATCRKLSTVDVDDAALVAALGKEGHDAEIVAWDAEFDWSEVAVTVIRSTWDYHERLPEFLAWADRAERVTRLCNDAGTVRWNAHKFYLRELASVGIPIAPTVFLARGTAIDLPALLAERGWRDAIVKPAVSAGAYQTVRVDNDVGRAQRHLDALLGRGDALVQPFLRAIGEEGERSHVFIDGKRTHSVRRPGGLGVPLEQQNVAEPIVVPEDEERLCGAVLRAAGRRPTYARIDLLRDEAGKLVLMEFELIEPSLFLWCSGEGARPLARAIGRFAERGAPG